MKPIKTLEDAIAWQKERKSRPADAYVNYASRWKASRFAMNIIREISRETGEPLLSVYNRIQSSNGFEQYILKHYDIMHTQDFLTSVHDVEKYIGSR